MSNFFPASKLAIGHFFRRIAFRLNRPIDGDELIHGNAQAFRSKLQQRLARRGCSLGQIASIEIGGMRLAAGSDALIRRDRRVAGDQIDAMKRHAKFLGDQLNLRRGHALAEFFFSGVGGHAAVRGDGDPGIDFIRRRRIRAAPPCACASSVQAAPAPMLKLTISAPVPFMNDLRENPARFKAADASEVMATLEVMDFSLAA